MSAKINLIQKYNVPGPRYTSYPTVPVWQAQSFQLSEWIKQIQNIFIKSNQEQGISLYIHLPFCESLCTFCACHKHITKKHDLEDPYIESLLKEWSLYRKLFDTPPKIREIHLGGGTPTFFSAKKLGKLIERLLDKSELHSNYEFSFEGHPNSTTLEHLKTLHSLGFRRVSFGVQDYDPTVQMAINRIQSFEQVREVTEAARAIGYKSISHDLVFGLPKQTLDSMLKTIELTSRIKPDRLAFYSYAHVPWVKGVGQRGFDDSDLPKDHEKRNLYQAGKEFLETMDYLEIGMDHFSLKNDSLYQALENGQLHRNFMGYTSKKTDLMIGLGMSAISDSWTAFAQNFKTLKEYQTCLSLDKFPIFRGHILSTDDLIIRQHILNIMCKLETSWSTDQTYFKELPNVLNRLKILEDDALLTIGKDKLIVTEYARPFIRNICMAFDLYLNQSSEGASMFSKTI